MSLITILLSITIFNLFISILNKNRTILYCGIVGFSGNKEFDITKIKILMLSNVVRGIDSTGIYNGGVITKEAVSCEKFLSKNPIVSERLFIGHTRKATTAIVNERTAHPFQKGNIVGVHNGGITNKTVIEGITGVAFKDYDVDSELLIEAISQNKLKLVLEKLDGCVALIWTDITNPNYLYCLRNTERPLFRGNTPEGIYLSSIEESLMTIGIEKKDIREIPANRLFVFKNGVVDNNYAMPISGIRKYTATPPATNYRKEKEYYDSRHAYGASGYGDELFPATSNDVVLKYGDVVEIVDSPIAVPRFYYVIMNRGLFTEIFDHTIRKSKLVSSKLLIKQPSLKINEYCKTIFYNPEWKEKFHFDEDTIFRIRGIDKVDTGTMVHCDMMDFNGTVVIPERFLIKVSQPILALPAPQDDNAKLTDEDSVPMALSLYKKIDEVKTMFELIYMEIDAIGLFECPLDNIRPSYDDAIVSMEIILADIAAIKENE